MTIFEYLKQKGITARVKTTSEYSSSCPACGGEDRFIFWPGRERYFCRGCGRAGDLIDLLRGEGMSFADARRIAGQVNQNKPARPLPETCEVKEAAKVSTEWQKRATAFIRSAANRLQSSPDALRWLERKRGITRDTAKRFNLGWNEKDRYFTRSEWGLAEESQENGRHKKIWLPRGLIIPRYSHTGQLSGIKVRRHDEDIPNESKAMYVFVSGGLPGLSFYGFERTAFIIVESELDAILLHQAAGKNITPLSTGGAVAGVVNASIGVLCRARINLISTDNDMAGAVIAQQLLNQFGAARCNSCLYRVPEAYGKDHTEAMFSGLNLTRWLTDRLFREENKGGKNCQTENYRIDRRYD